MDTKTLTASITKSDLPDFDARFVVSSTTQDRDGDIVSRDALIKSAEQPRVIAYWEHRLRGHTDPVGFWKNLTMVGDDLVGYLKTTGTQVGQMVKMMLDDGVPLEASVGFLPVKNQVEKNPGGRYLFKAIDLLEISVVGNGANPRAVEIAKSLNLEHLLATPQGPDGPPAGQPSLRIKAAAAPVTAPTGTRKMKISERIEAENARLQAAKEELATLTTDQEALEGDPLTESMAKSVALNDEIELLVKSVTDLQRTEANLAAAAIDVRTPAPSSAGRGFPAVIRSRQDIKNPADLLFKSCVVAVQQYFGRSSLDQAIEARFGDDEVMKAVAPIFLKADSAPAISTVAGWAAELVEDARNSYLEMLRGESVVPQVPMAMHSFDRNGRIPIVGRTGSNTALSGAARAEGDPIRVAQSAYSTQHMTPKNHDCIVTFTNEIARRSTPSIMQDLSNGLLQDSATGLDGRFVGTAARSVTEPGGLQARATDDGTTQAASGTDTAAMVADTKTRMKELTGANMGRRPVWIMSEGNRIEFASALSPLGVAQFPSVANGVLLGAPIASSTNVPNTVILLVDAAEIHAVLDMPTIDISQHATLHFEDTAPVDIGTPGSPATVAAPAKNLYQTNSTALRLTQEIEWLPVRVGAVHSITGVAYVGG